MESQAALYRRHGSGASGRAAHCGPAKPAYGAMRNLVLYPSEEEARRRSRNWHHPPIVRFRRGPMRSRRPRIRRDRGTMGEDWIVFVARLRTSAQRRRRPSLVRSFGVAVNFGPAFRRRVSRSWVSKSSQPASADFAVHISVLFANRIGRGRCSRGTGGRRVAVVSRSCPVPGVKLKTAEGSVAWAFPRRSDPRPGAQGSPRS